MASASCSPALTLTLSHPRAQIPLNRSPFPARWHPISAFHSRTKQDFRARTGPLRFGALCLREQKAAVVTGDSWEKSVLKSEIPVLVEFYASWCGPCRMVHRLIDEVAMEYAGRLKCCVVNTDNDLQLAEDQDIKAVPVVLLFKNGKKCSSIVGTMPKEFYVAAVDKALL